jgi:hypothetical protein
MTLWHPLLLLLAMSGGMRHNDPSYSFGVRQAIWQRMTALNDTRVTYVDGGVADYAAKMRGHKYCLAPAGHGWGIRLSQYMLNGCVPVIIQVRQPQWLKEGVGGKQRARQWLRLAGACTSSCNIMLLVYTTDL